LRIQDGCRTTGDYFGNDGDDEATERGTETSRGTFSATEKRGTVASGGTFSAAKNRRRRTIFSSP